MIAAFAAALLQPAAVPPPEVTVPYPARPAFPPPPPYGPGPHLVVDSVYALQCRVTAGDGARFEIKAKASGRGADRRMAIESGAPGRFPSGTAAGDVRPRNWPSDERIEIFTLERPGSVYTLTLGWAAERLTEAALTVLRPGAEQPFGSPGAVTCRRR